MLSPNCRPASSEQVAAVAEELYDNLVEIAQNPNFVRLSSMEACTEGNKIWDIFIDDDTTLDISKPIPYGKKDVQPADEIPTLLSYRNRFADRGVFELKVDAHNGSIHLSETDEYSDRCMDIEDFLGQLSIGLEDLPDYLQYLAGRATRAYSTSDASLTREGFTRVRLGIDELAYKKPTSLFPSVRAVNLSVAGISHFSWGVSTHTQWQDINGYGYYTDVPSDSVLVPVYLYDTDTDYVRPSFTPKFKGTREEAREALVQSALDPTCATLTIGRLHEVRKISKELLTDARVELAALNNEPVKTS